MDVRKNVVSATQTKISARFFTLKKSCVDDKIRMNKTREAEAKKFKGKSHVRPEEGGWNTQSCTHPSDWGTVWENLEGRCQELDGEGVQNCPILTGVCFQNFPKIYTHNHDPTLVKNEFAFIHQYVAFGLAK